MEKHAEKARMLKAVADPSLEELAACQGIHSIADFDALLGRPSREDESAEEFHRMLREWRSENNGQARAK